MLARVIPSLLFCTLLACSSNYRAPVEDRGARSRPVNPPVSTTTTDYRVQKGDTLYSIAFRYGLDFRKMAAANRIAAPYTIYPGQRVQLREAALPRVTSTPASKSAPQVASSKTTSTAKSKTVAKPVPVASPAAVAKPAATKTNKNTAYSGSKVSAWRWPTGGRVTRGYSGSVHKGIDISGKRGDPVVAVADGKVVYAGSGIVGFGELLIIKHNELYLSAYGHNDRLLVREGQVVKAGQEVAAKGSTGTDTVKLHFEIRKEGKPIDPQRLLPRR